jgi:hypothetical protein
MPFNHNTSIMRLVAATAAGIAVAGPLATATPVAAATDVDYIPPVDAPVVDAFRPPETPYGPGNRGLKYATRAGDPVRASADGSVTFAGQVGGTLHVTIRHADGIRTSYSFLDRVAVVLGQQLRQGDLVGTAGEVLHFGARRGDAYIDPASLLGGRPGAVELIPFEVAPGATRDEVESLRQTVFGGDGGRPEPSRRAAAVVDWLRRSPDATATADPPGRSAREQLLEMAIDIAQLFVRPHRAVPVLGVAAAIR